MKNRRIRKFHSIDTNETEFEYTADENIEVKDDISLLRLVDNYLFLFHKLVSEESENEEAKDQTDLLLRQRDMISAIIDGKKCISNSVITELLKKIHLSFEEFLLLAVLLIETALSNHRFFISRYCDKIRESDRRKNRIDPLELISGDDYINLRDLLSVIGVRNPENYDIYIGRLEEYGLIEKKFFSKIRLGGSETYIKLSRELCSIFNAAPDEDDFDDEEILQIKADTIRKTASKYHILTEDPLIQKILGCITDYKRITDTKNKDIEPPKIILYGEDEALASVTAKLIAFELKTGILTYKLCEDESLSFFFHIEGRRKKRRTALNIENRIFRLAFLGNSLLKLYISSGSDLRSLIQFFSGNKDYEKTPYNLPILIQVKHDISSDFLQTDILKHNMHVFRLDGLDNRAAAAYLSHLLGGYNVERDTFFKNPLTRLGEIELIAKVANQKATKESVSLNENILEESRKIVLCAIEADKSRISDENSEENDSVYIENNIPERLPDIILNPGEERDLKNILFAIKNKERLYSEIIENRFNYGKGIKILFYGPPGTGKTLSARVIAGETGMPLIYVRLSQLYNKYVGDTEKNIRRYFETAEKRNAILFFDECDSLIMSRDNLSRSFEFSFANTFLKEVENYNGVLILATNYENIRDKALNRRIQFFLRFENPDYESRIRLLKKTIPEKYQNDIDLSSVAELRFNGGHLKNVWLKAGIEILKGKRADTDFFIDALKEEISKEKTDEDKKAGF